MKDVIYINVNVSFNVKVRLYLILIEFFLNVSLIPIILVKKKFFPAVPFPVRYLYSIY